MDIEQLLNEEIENRLENLRDLDESSDEYKKRADNLVKLLDRAIEIKKLNIQDRENSAKHRDANAVAEFDKEHKLKLIEEERQDRFIRNVIAVAGIAVPTVVTIWGTLKSFEFEKEGTITTMMGRGFINKLLRK